MARLPPPPPLPERSSLALDPAYEAAATAWLSARRGKAVWSGPPPIARMIENLIPPDQRKGGMTVKELQSRWRDVVGEKLASICQPDAIKGETLVVRVVAAAAPLLAMRTNEIVGLVRLAGASRIRKLSLVRGPLMSRAQAKSARTHRKLTATEQRKLDEQLEQVSQPGLKAALARLAEATAHLD